MSGSGIFSPGSGRSNPFRPGSSSSNNPFRSGSSSSNNPFKSPATDTFRVTSPGSGFSGWLDQVEGKSGSRQAELFGATPGFQRREELQPRYDVWSQAPEIAGVSVPDDRGVISRAMDYALRPGYGAAGFVTGLLGLETYSTDRDMLGDAVLPSRMQTAFQRLGRGLSGESQYRFKDFSPIAKKKSEGVDVPSYQNAANVVGGFVFDTMFDPLTYVSFGGNLYGRRLGARYVGGRVQAVADDVVGSPTFSPRRFLEQTYDSGRASAITPAALASKAVALRRQALNANIIVDPADIAALVNTNLSATLPMNVLLDNIAKMGTKEINFMREIAREWLPDAAAMQYWTGSARGLRKWLIRTMGVDEGMDFYRALPKDIQGGIRFRLPFVREDTLPVALKLTPGGGGQLAEALSKRGITAMEKMLDVTEAGRDIVRKVLYNTPGIRRIFVQGKFSEVAYDAIVAATGRKTAGSPGRTAFVTYGDMERANWKAITGANAFNSTQSALRMASSESYAESVKDLSVEESRRVSREIYLYLSNRELLEQHLADPSLVTSDFQSKALIPASMAVAFLDNMGEEIVSLGINERTLKNFAMRIPTMRESARRTLDEDAFTPTGGGKAASLKERDAHVFEWAYDVVEGARVVRWDIAADIREVVDGQWENPYITDFITALFSYSDDVTRTLDSWRLAKTFSEAGIFTPKEREQIVSFNRSLVERDINELIGQGGQGGSLRALRSRLVDFLEGGETPGFDTGRARAAGIELESYNIAGTLTRANIDEYFLADSADAIKGVAQVWNGRDGFSRIYRLDDGRFEVLYKNKKIVTTDSFGDAVQTAQDFLMDERDVYYNTYIINKMNEVLSKIDQLLYLEIGQNVPRSSEMILNINPGAYEAAEDALRRGEISLKDKIPLDIHFGLWRYTNDLPPAEADAVRRAIVNRATELVEYFGRVAPDVKIDKYGEMVVEGAPRQWLDKRVKEEFRNFISREAWADLRMDIFLPDGTVNSEAVRKVQQRVLARMEDVVAPRVVMDAYTRMVEINQNPNRLITAYDSFYAALRSSMTAWRGPGFVGRNLLGGSYNATVYGVGAKDFTDAGAIIAARFRARKAILDRYGDEAYTNVSLEQEMIDEFKKQLGQYFKGSNNYLDGVSDVDAITEIWKIGYDADLLGGARTSRFIGEILLRAPMETPRLGAFNVQRPFDRRGNLARYIDAESVVGSPSTQGGRVVQGRNTLKDIITPGSEEKWQRAMQWVATDNPWVSRVMGPAASTSEDFLRLASFLKGVRDFGLEPAESGIRGFSAATMVKLTQFDYSDLSPWELRFFKNIMPFWVWTRNNIPLQVRSFVHNPGRVAKYARGVEGFQSFFQEDYKGPMPTYTENQFSVYIDPSYWDGAPRFLKPILPKGTVAFSPFPWLDPLVDLNRWFKIGTNPVNWPELANNVNPIINGIAELLGMSGNRTDYAGRNERDAPRWMTALGLSRPDDADPSLRVANQNVRDLITNIVPQFSLAERYFPFFFGEQRQRDKWMTTMISALTGLTISTIDDSQVAGQMQTEIDRNKAYIDRKWGPSAPFRMNMIRELLEEGAPLWFIQAIDIGNLPENELDVERAVLAWKMYQQLFNSFEAMSEGLDPEGVRAVLDELIRPYQQYLSPDQKTGVSVATGIWGSLENFRGDFNAGVRAGAWQPPTNAEISEAGTSRNEITRLLVTRGNENLPEADRQEANFRLLEIYDIIANNRNIGMFNPFGEKNKDWEPE
jgi:hypothetical protein